MKNIITITFFLTFYISIYGQTIYQDSIAPKIGFTDWIGDSQEAPLIHDKPIVLEFWSTWCRPCIDAIPHFNSLTQKYRNDITFIAVNSFESKEMVTKFLYKQQILSFVVLDENKRLKTAFNIQNIPVTIIIDKEGFLRWRGVTSELTDDILYTFITRNSFENSYKKGTILNQEFSIESLENVNYRLEIEYGDATLGRSISTNSEDTFHLKLENYSIYSILSTFSDWFEMEDNWEFKGNLPNRSVISLSIESNAKLNNESDKKKLLRDVIFRLSEFFNFEIRPKVEMQTIWYIIPDTIQLEKYYSKNQDLDVETIETTVNERKYQNIFFEYLASYLSNQTKQKVVYQPLFTHKKYDLTILKSKDIREIGIYLKEKYGIDLVKKEEKVNVKVAIFK